MTHKTYSILAVYRSHGGESLVRHIADVSTDGPSSDLDGAFTEKAFSDLPKGAAYLSMMVALPKGSEGYDATMAKVNVGVMGYPA
jgi:hypothetical protein